MSGLFNRRAPGRGHLHLSYRAILGVVLLATQALVSPLLAEPGHYSWTALAESASVLIYSGGKAGMGARVYDGDLVVTCAHVIGNESDIEVEGIGMPKEKATLIAKDDRLDVAVLRLKTVKIPFKMYWGQDGLPKGTRVIQANKLHFEGPASITHAEVTAHMWSGNPVISAKPRPGYSGGAVFLANGQLVGITAGAAIDGERIGTDIIPVEVIRKLLP